MILNLTAAEVAALADGRVTHEMKLKADRLRSTLTDAQMIVGQMDIDEVLDTMKEQA